MNFNSSATSIVRQLEKNGYSAYIVGGAVRDMLLHRIPKDYDITTDATPEQVRQVFGRRRCRIIGRRFRLALVFDGGESYEVSTFRRDPTKKERRTRPQDDGVMIWDDNQFGTMEDDVMRRDFTANALYYDVYKDKIIDMVGGVPDIRRRLVRCIGEPGRRFHEDPVRMLRALKLAGQFGFTLADDVERAIRENGQLVQEASKARLFEELMKIMSSESALEVFGACQDCGFLEHFFPALSHIWDTDGGDVIKGMLRQHGRCLVEEDNYYHEKSFSLSVLCLPYIIGAMNGCEPSNYQENRNKCLDAVKLFFSAFPMPREVEFNICDLALMVADMAAGERLQRMQSSVLYPLAYELFRLLTMASGWMADSFKKLTPPWDESPGLLCLDVQPEGAAAPAKPASKARQAPRPKPRHSQAEAGAEENRQDSAPKRRRRRRRAAREGGDGVDVEAQVQG